VRATTTLSSYVEIECLLDHARTPPRSAHAACSSAVESTAAAPCRRNPSGRLEQRRLTTSTSVRPASSSTPRTAPRGIRCSTRNSFSARRSWAIATAWGDGATSTDPARRSRAAAGGFSNSVVTTSHAIASRSSADGRRTPPRGARRPRPGRCQRIGVEHDRAVAHRARRHEGEAAELAAAEHADRAGGVITWWLMVAAAATKRHDRDAAAAIAVEGLDERGLVGGEQRDGEQCCVGGAGLADGERGNRHPGGHLHDRQQGVLSREVTRRDRHAEHRHGGLGGQHPRQVGGAAGPGHDRPEPRSRAADAYSNISSGIRWALTTRASWATPKRLEHGHGGLHGGPVAGRPHHDAHQRARARSQEVDHRRAGYALVRRAGMGAGYVL
jgi:hypothetical protein